MLSNHFLLLISQGINSAVWFTSFNRESHLYETLILTRLKSTLKHSNPQRSESLNHTWLHACARSLVNLTVRYFHWRLNLCTLSFINVIDGKSYGRQKSKLARQKTKPCGRRNESWMRDCRTWQESWDLPRRFIEKVKTFHFFFLSC